MENTVAEITNQKPEEPLSKDLSGKLQVYSCEDFTDNSFSSEVQAKAMN